MFPLAGTTQFHLRNPYVIAWWSAAFPGFGHLLLSKYLRGFTLFMWEVVVNYNAKINLAMVHSFCGDIETAKEEKRQGGERKRGYRFFQRLSTPLIWN